MDYPADAPMAASSHPPSLEEKLRVLIKRETERGVELSSAARLLADNLTGAIEEAQLKNPCEQRSQPSAQPGGRTR